ncbi:unnamed protein product [Acanthoscelides obtectus]|uniref:Secreted protein n=1 Tax=Acanthoscelides obtectus TaxID=200917 RepID=A0A9P0MEI2_ACAOB|nr:unnamed protein product [Acanthoscelides obtectus]CAH2010184.1 unnamed protein product [Acanthoscelides obtectus]CAK1624217.1 hypothetical protein AOBTE_LOCUS2412 [Acanthoscelides obtectus]CAK1633002.1 hypothetical protein AOBTE_LOCUS7869 [Acanthoscelides obtectus]
MTGYLFLEILQSLALVCFLWHSTSSLSYSITCSTENQTMKTERIEKKKRQVIIQKLIIQALKNRMVLFDPSQNRVYHIMYFK